MRTRPTATTVLALLLELPHGDERIPGAVPGQAPCLPSVIVVHKEELVEKDAEDVWARASTIAASTGASHKRRHLPPGQARPPGAHLPRAQALRSRTSFLSRANLGTEHDAQSCYICAGRGLFRWFN